jgi:hypothetical protein
MEPTVEIGPAHVLFLVLALSTLFFMVTWAIGVAVRLHLPENTLPVSSLPVIRRQVMARKGQPSAVGVREIREDERLRMSERPPVEYEYAGLPTRSLPQEWIHDLHARRN